MCGFGRTDEPNSVKLRSSLLSLTRLGAGLFAGSLWTLFRQEAPPKECPLIM